MKHNPNLSKNPSANSRTNVVPQNANAQPTGPGVSEQPEAPATQYPSYDEISSRAYGLWEKSGFGEGRDLEHWYEAERQISRGKQSEVF